MREEHLKAVTDGLKWLVHKLDGRSKGRLYDLHIVSEDFVREFLNCLRDLNLINLNSVNSNHPAIDLGDKAKRLCFQVTTERTAQKVQKGLDTFLKHSLDSEYDQMFFLILGEKQKKYSTIKCNAFKFDPSHHVIDISDLIREASFLDMTRLEQAAKIIDRAGLLVSPPQDSDEQAFRKIYSHFDRDALKHPWQQEGSIIGFETALKDLTELLGKGTIDKRRITKPAHLFSDTELVGELAMVQDALGKLKALFNHLVNSGKICRGDRFAILDRETVEKMNRAKLEVIEEINKIGRRYSLKPISMNQPIF